MDPRADQGARELAVNCHEIVRGHQATEGRSPVKRAMAALPIVVVEPDGQGLGPLSRTGVGATVRPLAQQGLDEALRLAVGPGRVGARAQMAQVPAATELREAGR